MKEFEMLAKDQFFIIDSGNLDSVQTRLYGFAIEDGSIVQDEDLRRGAKVRMGGGTYVLVEVKGDTITISQDIDGSYGLYLFRSGSYFALSNSFLKLAYYVARQFPISFNQDYADALIALPLNAMSYSQTLVKEISMLPRNTRVSINKIDGTLRVERGEIKESTVNLDSREAFVIMDDWYKRWTGLLRRLKQQTDHIRIDLTGGFDSRVAFVIALGADIDLSRVRINSNTDGLHTHGEDYKIASDIGEHYGFPLNQGAGAPHFFYRDAETPLAISWYIKAGFHKQMYWKFNYAKEPVFSFGGEGGEIINGHGMLGVNNGNYFVDAERKRAGTFSSAFVEPVGGVMEDLIHQVAESYGVYEDCSYITLLLYRDTICRNHFGKNNVESLFSNTFSCQPLMDPGLRQLKNSTEDCPDSNLLMALLLTRYAPGLLDFPYQGGRSINPETVRYAEKLNRRYPFVRQKRPVISAPDQPRTVRGFFSVPLPEEKNKSLTRADVERPIRDIFDSKLFRNLFSSYFPEQVYAKVYRESRNRAFFPLQEVYACIAAMQMLQLCHESQTRAEKGVDFFRRALAYRAPEEKGMPADVYAEIMKYATARVDIKNFGDSDNTINILSSTSPYATPGWFTDSKGKGFVFQSLTGSMHIMLEAAKAGELRVILRGVDARDKNNTRYPVWIDYTGLSVNGAAILPKPRLICHDEPFVYRKKVVDGEIVDIETTWRPLSKESEWKKR